MRDHEAQRLYNAEYYRQHRDELLPKHREHAGYRQARLRLMRKLERGKRAIEEALGVLGRVRP